MEHNTASDGTGKEKKNEDIVRHAVKLLPGKVFAIEIQVLGKPVDPLEQTQVRAPDESHFPGMMRRGKIVEHQQLNIFFEDMLQKSGITAHGCGIEIPDLV
jgi:hypothetical protein